MIDIHHHLLYGLDDGPSRFDEAARMAECAAQDGIRTLIATPHVYPGVRPFQREMYDEALERLNQHCSRKGVPLSILGGAEIRHTDAAVRLLEEGRLPTMNGTSFVLVEWSTSADAQSIADAVREYANAGYRVIIAHIERYRGLWLKKGVVETLKNGSCQMKAIVTIPIPMN